MADEYIKKSTVLDIICKHWERKMYADDAIQAALDEIGYHVPSADVQPVRHGQNIRDTVPGHCEFKCSLCGVELSTVYGGKNDFGMDGGNLNYCPNCGCRMDLETDDG